MPTGQLVEWMTYFEMKEQREKQRLVDTLVIVLAQLFPKQEG